MKSGRVEYAPDYKSEAPPARDYISLQTVVTVTCPEFGQSDCEHANMLSARIAKEVVERARLEREVIEAAKADMTAEVREEGDNQGIDRLIAARRRYRAAVTALLEFESKQK